MSIMHFRFNFLLRILQDEIFLNEFSNSIGLEKYNFKAVLASQGVWLGSWRSRSSSTSSGHGNDIGDGLVTNEKILKFVQWFFTFNLKDEILQRIQKFLTPISKACDATRKKQKTKIEKGIKNRNSLDARQDLNMTKTVQELERKWVEWHNIGSKAFSIRLETEYRERANRFRKGENSWKAISNDLASLRKNNLGLGGNLNRSIGSAIDPWESVAGFQQI